jgi:hypothetical protein
MSFRYNENQQLSMTDRLNNLTARERRILDKSWAKSFAERVFPLIDESRFEVLYCNDNGRPNTPVNIIVGALFLKELNQVTDEELLDEILFDGRYQYALHLTSYEEIPFSDRTVSRFRARLYEHEMETGEDLLKAEIEGLGAAFAKVLKIDGKLKRMDSAMVSSSCKNMGRLELIYTCVVNLVRVLDKSGELDMLPAHFREYTKENRNSVCYRLEKGEVKPRLEEVTAHAMELYGLAAGALGGEAEFQLLERMLFDQTKDGKLKPNKEISPHSLQNPSDEDATYRRKGDKGHHGYVVNFVEDCGENGNIVTQYSYDVNTHSDTEFCAETIETLGEQETVLIADGAYFSDENFKLAQENNTLLVPTALTGEKPSEIIAGFDIKEETIVSCPAGHIPADCKYNPEKELYRAHFDKKTCEDCPHREECPVILQKKTALVRLSTKTISRAILSSKLSTEEYKKYARKRNGVEGVPSVLRRRYRMDEMPVRGLVRTKMWMGFKIGAMNVKKLIAGLSFSLFSPRFCTFYGKTKFISLFGRIRTLDGISAVA